MAADDASKRSAGRAAPTAIAALLAALLLAGCQAEVPPDRYDTEADLSRDDYRRGLAAKPRPRPPQPPPIPDLQPVVDVPELSIPQGDQRVTVTVNEQTPLKDVLIELAREVGVDLELDPRIEGGIIFSAYQRPFEEVIRRIADLAGLRYRFRDGVLRIEFDFPYHVNYRIDYLSLVRSASSEVTSAGSVVRGDDTGGTAGGGGASTSQITSESEADFWTELTDNIEQIMVNTRRSRALIQLPDEQGRGAGQGATAEADGAAQGTGAPGAVTQAAQTTQGQQAQGAAAQAPQQAGQGQAARFSVNKQAGILSVFGTQRQHLAIRDYLEKLRQSVGSQVLIEAKVLNVRLNEEHRFGINWRALIGGASISGNFVSPVTSATDLLTIDTGGDDLSAVANLIEDFGTVRALSSPRLTVLQNQTAVLKVAEEEVFFEIDSRAPVISEGEVIASTPDTEINTVSVGLVMTVQPFINTATREITLTLRPSVTRIVRRVPDPIVPASVVPVIAAQEMDSVVTLRSGQVVVMGGLMQDNTSVDEAGVPVISEIPWIGRLFKGRSETIEKEELVVLLRATILNGRGYAPYDAELYNRFGRDRRPFLMQQ